MVELWLVRHAHSVANQEGWVTGCEEVEITDIGVRQAKKMGVWLREGHCLKPDIYVTSSMRRAIQTANLLGFHDDYKAYPELNETDAGDVSYWKRSVFDEKFRGFWEQFDENRRFPGGESHRDLFDRVIQKTGDILNFAEPDSKVLMVVHAGTISSIFHHAYGVPLKYFSRFVVRNCSLSILRYEQFGEPPALILYDQIPSDNIIF